MGRILFGVFLVLLGLGFFADQLNFGWLGLNFGSVMSLFWVAVGIVCFIKRNVFWGTVLTILGVLGFISAFFPNISTWSLFLPVIFVALGISVLFRNPEKRIEGQVVKGTTGENEIKETVAFGSLEKRYTTDAFKGGKIDCAFGGFKLDLREIKVAKEGAVLEVNSAFGGGEILVPSNIAVISEGTGIMGGWSNKFSTVSSNGSNALRIKGNAIFGGVEVKN